VNIIPSRPCGERRRRGRIRGKRLHIWKGLLPPLHGQHGNLIRITHPLYHHLRHSLFPSDLPQACLALVRRVNLVGLKNNLSKSNTINQCTISICLPFYALCHPMPYPAISPTHLLNCTTLRTDSYALMEKSLYNYRYNDVRAVRDDPLRIYISGFSVTVPLKP